MDQIPQLFGFQIKGVGHQSEDRLRMMVSGEKPKTGLLKWEEVPQRTAYEEVFIAKKDLVMSSLYSLMLHHLSHPSCRYHIEGGDNDGSPSKSNHDT